MSNKSKTTVLIVTTYFPPINSVACNRMVAFAKYLNKELFDVHVITLDEKFPITEEISQVKVYRIKNSSLFRKFSFNKKTSVFIRRSKSLYNKILLRLFFKEYNGWEKQAIKKCKELIYSGNKTVIISSYAHIEAHLVPLSLKKQGYAFNWIADFRDEMSLNPYNVKKWQNKITFIEQEILNNVDALTTVSKPFIDNFKKLSNRNDLFFEEVRNGYDFEYSSSITSVKNTKFIVNYSGGVYASTDLCHFYSAINNIINKFNIQDFEIQFIGVGNSFNIPLELQQFILKTDRIPHKEAILEMMKADAFLFMFPNNGWKGVYSGKLFEYLAYQKPIIALTDPDDVAADLIRKCNSGFIATFDNAKEIEDVFLKAYHLWKNNEKLVFNEILIEQHHRKHQVAIMEKLILKIVNG